MKVKVVLEFDENDLGPKWMNPYNLDILLYSGAHTNKGCLQVVSYEEACPEDGKCRQVRSIKKGFFAAVIAWMVGIVVGAAWAAGAAYSAWYFGAPIWIAFIVWIATIGWVVLDYVSGKIDPYGRLK